MFSVISPFVVMSQPEIYWFLIQTIFLKLNLAHCITIINKYNANMQLLSPISNFANIAIFAKWKHSFGKIIAIFAK